MEVERDELVYCRLVFKRGLEEWWEAVGVAENGR